MVEVYLFVPLATATDEPPRPGFAVEAAMEVEPRPPGVQLVVVMGSAEVAVVCLEDAMDSVELLTDSVPVLMDSVEERMVSVEDSGAEWMEFVEDSVETATKIRFCGTRHNCEILDVTKTAPHGARFLSRPNKNHSARREE